MVDNTKMMEGMIKCAEVYGTVCSGKNCDECNVGIVRGEGVTCAEFAKQFPKKFVSLLLDAYKDGVTYAEEYATRFPSNDLGAEDLVALGMCRKAVFAGDLSCEDASEERCLECWKARYISDVEEVYEVDMDEAQDSGVTFEFGE